MSSVHLTPPSITNSTLLTVVDGVAVHTTDPWSVAPLLMLDVTAAGVLPSGGFLIRPAEPDDVPMDAAKTAAARTTMPFFGARNPPDCREPGRGGRTNTPSG